MKVIPIMPIDTFYGKLNEKGKYYFRRSRNGTIYACRCPDRSNHIKTPAEAANQQRFATVSAAVKARKTDLMNISADKQAFLEQRDTAGGKTTFKSYLWKVCGDAYDQAHPRN